MSVNYSMITTAKSVNYVMTRLDCNVCGLGLDWSVPKLLGWRRSPFPRLNMCWMKGQAKTTESRLKTADFCLDKNPRIRQAPKLTVMSRKIERMSYMKRENTDWNFKKILLLRQLFLQCRRSCNFLISNCVRSDSFEKSKLTRLALPRIPKRFLSRIFSLHRYPQKYIAPSSNKDCISSKWRNLNPWADDRKVVKLTKIFSVGQGAPAHKFPLLARETPCNFHVGRESMIL